MKLFFKYLGISFILITLWGILFRSDAAILQSFPLFAPITDTIQDNDTTENSDTSNVVLPIPFPEDEGTPFSNSNETSPLYGPMPSNYTNEVVFDPVTNQYIFKEKIGNLNYRNPQVMSFDEYRNFDLDNSMKKYWHMKAANANFENNRSLIPQLHIGGEAFDKIFGSSVIDIRPQGTAELTFGINSSKTENPALPIKLRRNTTFDFKEKIQMNVVGQIGTKLKINANYDTEAGFEFENKMKLAYEGNEDEIIQTIEAGNVSLPLTGSLITGSQSLFGIKTKLKFGKLDITSIFSQQKGKSEVIEVKGGAQTQEFEIYADQYESNKHYFLAHYFKEHYDKALENLPVIISPINITRIEVWVTNKSGNYQDSRNIVAFMDLGEKNIIESSAVTPYSNVLDFPSDSVNTLYDIEDVVSGVRELNTATSELQGNGFITGIDFEKIESARKLSPSEYNLNPKLGYISLNAALNSDEVLAVAYEFTAGGKKYQVGEFSSDGINAPKALIVKLIKGTSFTPQLPNWGLMMKNIYAIGAYQINPSNFKLDILYQDDKKGTAVNYLSEGAISGYPLIQVLNLDNVNQQLDPSPDGVFDFIEGTTVLASNGKIIFPVLEPFGSNIKKAIIGTNPADSTIANKYVYQELYDSTQNTAQQIAEKNKFFLAGTYQSASGSDISLNAINIPQGSVQVTAGGRQLIENQDYTVDYTLGRVKIINQGLLESGTPIKISLESNTMFSIQSKTLMGTHLDYHVSNDFNLGATILNLTERPLTQKVNIGDEPISNTIWGIDGTYRTDSRFLTKMIDKLPLLETKEMSNITISGEFAHLIPGHSKAIDKTGTSYIDDFEGSKTSIDIKSYTAWSLASTPQHQPDLFPEADTTGIVYGINRAKLAWYYIEPLFVHTQSETPDYLKNSDEQNNHFVREVYEKELFPNRESPSNYPTTLAVLNLAYYPTEKGPYNYDISSSAYSSGMNASGLLNNPASRWGGIMRSLQTNDFEAANIEFIDFWLMDPFVYDTTLSGGDLYFNLGDISEDILKDSRKTFEQGLPTSDNVINVDTTVWGRIPLVQTVTNGFDNNPLSRPYQDVGFDGLMDADEQLFFGAGNIYGFDYIDSVKSAFGTSSSAYQNAVTDPSSDDFHYFRGTDYDNIKLSILERYKKYNGPDGNSPTDEQSPETYPTQGTSIPDDEDINNDNTLSEAENYFQYRIQIHPSTMHVGENYITDIVPGENKSGVPVNWYHFRVPISEPEKIVGAIKDFKSIRFIRMFLKNFSDSVILRFGTLELVRNDWRKYNASLMEGGLFQPDEPNSSAFEVSAVNIEENNNKNPVNYILPPGISRVIDPMQPQLRQLNEQALLLRACELADGDARAVYKNVFMDIRQYKRIKMFIHAESITGSEPINDNDVSVFIRMGSDYQGNYYEYEIPLKVTAAGNYNNDDENDQYIVWPEANELNLEFSVLQAAKQKRNDAMHTSGSNVSLTTPFRVMDGNNTITIMGNPNMSNIKTIMIGIRNRRKDLNPLPDDGRGKCVEVWVNELRLTDFNEKGGWAANARVTTKLADFGTVTLSGMTSKPGFGSIEKKVSERSKEDVYQYDISSNLSMGKFFPKKSGIQIPMYIGYSERISNPQYNPLDPDIPLKVALSDPNLTEKEKANIKYRAQDYTKRKSLNFTNVQIAQSKGKPRIYDISNWSTTYSYAETFTRNINTEYNLLKNYRGALNYNYNTNPKDFTPFKNSKFLKKKYFTLIRDFNFYLMPQNVSFMTDLNRDYNEVKLRNLSEYDIKIPSTVNKNFFWNRNYNLKYKLTKSITFDFGANTNSRIDEMDGRINKEDDDYEQKRDTILKHLQHFGRVTNYQHDFNLNYNLPINKLPGLDWLNVSTRFGGRYSWEAAPKLNDTLNPGNNISNGQSLQINTQANLLNFYNNFPVLKRIQQKYRKDKQNKKPQKEKVYYPEQNAEPIYVNLKEGIPKSILHKLKTIDVDILVTDSTGKPVKGTMKVINENRITFTPDTTIEGVKIQVTGMREISDELWQQILEHTALLMMSVKNIQVSYTDNSGTMLPGYMPSVKIMGTQKVNGKLAPGIPFIAGIQDTNFVQMAMDNEWLKKDTLFYQTLAMTSNRTINVRSSVEPIKNLRIDFMANWGKSENKRENIAFENNAYQRQNTMTSGNFTMSYNTWNTAFQPIKNMDGLYISDVFEKFRDYRITIAKRLARERAALSKHGYNSENYDPVTGFPDGYGPYSQEVLIPAFMSAYSGRSPDHITLSTFPNYLNMRPNWRINYNGLTKIKLVKHFVQTATISHAYTSTYSINSYSQNLNYQEYDNDHLSYVRDLVNNFYPENEIPTVSINEQLNPLINFDVTWNNSLITRIEVKKTRNISLNVTNAQVNEMRTNEWTIGSGYRIKDLEITIGSGGKSKNFKSDLNIRLDLSIRDQMNLIHRVEENNTQVISGQNVITLKTYADYVLGPRFNIRIFFDKLINKPKVSITFPTSNTNFGVSVRFSLAQ